MSLFGEKAKLTLFNESKECLEFYAVVPELNYNRNLLNFYLHISLFMAACSNPYSMQNCFSEPN